MLLTKQTELTIHSIETALAAGITVDILGMDAGGHSHVRGFFFTDLAPAAGFPRVRQGRDGTNWSITEVIPQDFAQPNFTFTFNIRILARFITVEFTAGGGGSTVFRSDVRLVPVGD